MRNEETPTLVLLAAGAGLRFGGSKQLEPMGPCGELLLEYSIHGAVRAGFGRIVLVVRREAEPFFRERLDRASRTIPIEYAYQRDPLGTGHALLCAKGRLHGPFAVANADDVYGARSFDLLARALEGEDREGYMIGFELARTLSPHGPVARALCRQDENALLVALEEHLAVSEGRSLVSMNLWGFRPPFLEALERRFASFGDGAEFQLPTVVAALIAEEDLRVRVLATDEPWLGVTWPADEAWVREALASGSYPSPLWEAV